METKQRLDGWAIKEGDKFIGLDQASGGYPYIPRDFRGIYIWNTEEDALQYKGVFKGSEMGGSRGMTVSSWNIVRIVLMEI